MEGQTAWRSCQGHGDGTREHSLYRLQGSWSDSACSNTAVPLDTPRRLIFILLSSWLCAPLPFFWVVSSSADTICSGLDLIHTACVFALVYTTASSEHPRPAHFSPWDFPFPSLPTSCSPICSRKTGRLSCLLVAIFGLFLLLQLVSVLLPASLAIWGHPREAKQNSTRGLFLSPLLPNQGLRALNPSVDSDSAATRYSHREPGACEGRVCQTAALKPSLSEGKMYREEREGRGAFLLTLLFSLLWLDSVAGFFARGPRFGLLFVYRAPVS